ncbi:MAG: MMPL family transporter [Clostridia bacterium]|nr:MMPL family transporter [Clostridia bacterium]
MHRFYRAATRYPKTVVLFFLLLAVVCALCKPLIAVNYDMNDYLPPDTASTLALDAMDAEYDGGVPNARVMVRNVTIPEALAYKQKLEAIDGVTSVTWLDDAADVRQPLETLDADTVSSYYQNGAALFSVTIADGKRIEAVDEIRALIGDDNAMSGSAVSTAVATTSTVSQVRIISVAAVAFVLFILLLTTTSWLEPLIVLGSLGVAILINSGSNLIFGEISFVSNAAGSILQLAVSLDYSIFLLHRFEECRRDTPDPREAMVEALCKSTMSILSSGLTTVIGFLALCLMQFQIGPDMGLVLGKGVAVSLITVFLFSPSLILLFHGLLERTRHRSFMPSFHGLGRCVTRLMLPMLLVLLLLTVPAYLGAQRNSYHYGSSHIFGANTQLGADMEAIEDVFGKSDTYVLMVPRGNAAREKTLSAALKELPQVSGVLSYVDNAGSVIPTEYVEKDTLSKLISENYSRMVLSVKVDLEGDEAFGLVERVRAIAESCYPGQWLLAGEGVSTCDMKTTVTSDMTKVNLIAIAAVFVVLLLSFKSLSLPVVLVLAIEAGIWINTAIPYFTNQSVFYISYLIITSIQLGATVDYAILFTDRYAEFRRGLPKKEAIVQTVSSVTVSILTSGLTLTVVGFLMGYISTHGLLSQLGFFLGRGALLSMGIVLFALPGMLYLLDGLIERTTKGAVFLKKGEEK